jgi:hypothetical protein
MTSMERVLTEEDFEECFHGEPAETDPAADLARGRTRRRQTRAVAATTGATAVAVVVLSLIAIFGPWTQGIEATPASGPTPLSVRDERTFLLPPDTNQRIYYSTIQSDPLPTPAPKVATGAAAAVGVARATGPAGTPSAALRMISAPEGLSGIPTSPEPYWVLVWPNTPPGPVGGPMLPNREAQEAAEKKRAADLANSSCSDVTFIDAATGHPVNGIWHLCTRQ